MATAKPSSADTPNATRQMLDELDALMARMLALPVNDTDEPGAAGFERDDGPALAATLMEVPSAAETDVPPHTLRDETADAGTTVLVGRLTPSYEAPEDRAEPSLPLSTPPSAVDYLPLSYEAPEEPPSPAPPPSCPFRCRSR